MTGPKDSYRALKKKNSQIRGIHSSMRRILHVGMRCMQPIWPGPFKRNVQNGTLGMISRALKSKTADRTQYVQCECGSRKWKMFFDRGYGQCLKCYKKYPVKHMKKLREA